LPDDSFEEIRQIEGDLRDVLIRKFGPAKRRRNTRRSPSK